ncbi:unnamed protein product, partial [Timema podura]|nr:unnamed protein product [Timema podura]
LTMGKHFGELAYLRGIVQYRLSPFEQRAFAGAFTKGLWNIPVRIRASIFRVAPREYVNRELNPAIHNNTNTLASEWTTLFLASYEIRDKGLVGY